MAFLSFISQAWLYAAQKFQFWISIAVVKHKAAWEGKGLFDFWVHLM